MSRVMNAEELALFARGPWAIETGLHWVLDEAFMEDRCTARVQYAPENLGLLRKTVFNVMKLDKHIEKMSMRAKQVYYRNNPGAIERLLFGEAPCLYEQ